jgi:predicted DsbA family dithiol-disulfide isomerase
VVRALALALALGAGPLGPAPAAADAAPPAAVAAAPRPAAPPTGADLRIEHRDPRAAPSRGPAHAPVTVELFFVPGKDDSTRRASALLEQLWRAHPRRIRVIYRVMMSSGAMLLPAAVLEAQAEGKFDELMDALSRARGGLARDQILQLATAAGVDGARLQAAWADGRYAQAFDDAEERRRRLHGRSTPEVLFNGQTLRRPIASVGASELEEAYRDAYDRALDLLDRGVARAELPAAFDELAAAAAPELPLQPGPTDDNLDGAAGVITPLANPPLLVDGLPGDGPPDAPIRVVVLCGPQSLNCFRQVALAGEVAELFPERVRVVWSPWFDVTRQDAAAQSLLADAALCAETLGAGWAFVSRMLDDASKRHGRRLPADASVDGVAAKVYLPRPSLAHCLAVTAGDALDRVAAARAAGVRSGPSLVVGGRIYPGGVADRGVLQALIEAELAPGVLGTIAPGWRRLRASPETTAPASRTVR